MVQKIKSPHSAISIFSDFVKLRSMQTLNMPPSSKWPSALKILILCLGLISAFSTKVWADEYEEVTYDDLINQIGRSKSQLSSQQENTAGFDSLQIHAGFGLVTTATTINYQGTNNLKYQNGFQISMGIDLFSNNWATEGVIRNFGQVTSGTETRSLRELDLKIVFRSTPEHRLGLRAGAGMGTRYFKLSDEFNGVLINDTTPTALAFAGFDIYASKNMSFGIETGIRSAMVASTTDKNSVDATFRLDTFF
jgi:hypothetical protein